MEAEKMMAAVATRYGNPDVLEIQEIEKPKPQGNEILVEVATASATRADSMMRSGKPYFARLFLGLRKPNKSIPGTGFAGRIAAVGSEVRTFKVGQRVFGETTFRFSANAEFLLVDESGVILPMPEHMDYLEAANFCDGHLTSYNFLQEVAHVQPGDAVLINGAAGALGTSAVQIAKHFGAEVSAVCSGKNEGLVRSLGADEVIDYKRVDFTQSNKKFDLVYDTVGKSSFRKCKKILKPHGKYLSPVLQFPLLLNMLWTSLFGKKKALFEATGANSAAKLTRLLNQVLQLHLDGDLKMVIDRQFPLEKVADAHRYIDYGHKRGNVVIVNSNFSANPSNAE